MVYLVSEKLLQYDLKYEQVPELWTAIATQTNTYKKNIETDLIRGIVLNLAKAKYPNEAVMRQFHDYVVSFHTVLDMNTLVDLRNTYV